jgi:cell wall-associated NlpC family hydrolase
MFDAVGKRYVLGGVGKDAYDCSGLVMMAFKSAGIKLPRTSGQQFWATQRISMKDIQPGDLLFFGKNGSQHVVMFIGDNKVVEAANPQFGVRISTMNANWYVTNFAGAGRVLATPKK